MDASTASIASVSKTRAAAPERAVKKAVVRLPLDTVAVVPTLEEPAGTLARIIHCRV